MTLQKLTPAERDTVVGLRADVWRGALTPDQFAERNRRLHAHPYGKRIETFGLKDDDGIVRGSLDFLGVKLWLGGKLEDGILVASIVTAPSDRGKGYGSELLEEAMKKLGSTPSILYSDIGAALYERYGYRDFSVAEISLPTLLPSEKSSAKPLTSDEMISELMALRRGKGSLAVSPEADRCDWHFERYRYFAELAGKAFPSECHWVLSHPGPHLLSAVPDFVAGRLEGVRVEPGCPKCVAFLHELASSWALPRLRYWDETTPVGGARGFPMARVSCARWADRQLGDWW